MDILRDYLIQVLNQKLDDSLLEGHGLKISQPVFTYLLADLYVSMGKCYLENGCDVEGFVKDMCLFVEREFFEG